MPNPMLRIHLLLSAMLALPLAANAADVSVQPASGSGFVVKDAGGATERFRVQESGQVSVPGAVGAAAQAQPLCMSAAGLLGPCSAGGGAYSAGTGLALSGTTFSVAPSYQLPQSCSANQLPQSNGAGGWTCVTVAGAGLPAGTVNQTLRYDASNTPVANNLLQAFDDGQLVAGGGILGVGHHVPSGAGIRMVWNPARAAFRAGAASATEWDQGNIGDYSFATGNSTQASGIYSVAMGYKSKATTAAAIALGSFATASGPEAVALGEHSTASGGDSTAMGFFSSASGANSIAMGSNSYASGDNSVALGYGADTAGNSGAFVYSDDSGGASSTAKNQFMVRASGGVVFYSAAGPNTTTGIQLPAGSGSWTALSDRNAKDAVQAIDARDVLAKVAALPLATWHYKTQDEKYRHMGPMAQDFYAAFHLGETDKGIDTIDADGVALAAIQGLHAENAELRARIAQLEAQAKEFAALKAAVQSLQRERATALVAAKAAP